MEIEARTVSIIIPAYNEELTIHEVVQTVLKSDTAGLAKEVVVVDDASADTTWERLRAFHANKHVRLIRHQKNLGKGAALRSGLQAARGDITIIQDADLEYNPEDYPKLLRPILDGKADVVYGSRFAGSDAHRVLYFWHYLGNVLLTLISNMFSNLNLTDMETGYKVFTAKVRTTLSPVLESNSFGFEPEFTAKVAKHGFRIYEVGISYSGRTYDEGKKIGLKDAFIAVYCIVRYNVFYSGK